MTPVYSDSEAGGYLGEYPKTFFRFKGSASIIIRNDTIPVSVLHKHSTDPTESLIIKTWVSNRGQFANPKRMIENAINKLSYLIYKELKEYE